MRIARFLARCGVASRRDAEQLVLDGRVSLNGTVVTDLGRQIDPATDEVRFSGRRLQLKQDTLTLAMNKPRGVVVTRSDPQGRPTVYDVLPAPHKARARELVYAGRLDLDTSGLLILTTDGDLANRLVHPRHHVDKEYEMLLDRMLEEDQIRRLERGIALEEGRTLPARIVYTGKDERPEYHMILQEGRNRQVRRMVEEVGCRVRRLRRVRIGGLSLVRLRLPEGEVQELSETEITQLLGGEK